MTWYTTTVPSARLTVLLTTIRSEGGTVTSAKPGADGVRVTWTTDDGQEPVGHDATGTAAAAS